MVSRTSNRDETSPVILIAIAVLGLIAGYFYYSSVLKSGIVEVPPSNIQTSDNLSKFKDLKLDFSPFDQLKFKSLTIFGESPVQPGSTGRADPFAPF